MPRETLRLLEQDVLRLLMAGGSLAAADTDLQKRQQALTALAPKVPVLSKVAEQVSKVLSANPKQASIELLNLSSVLVQLRAAQSSTNASTDKLTKAPKVEPLDTPLTPAQIDLIWRAFKGDAKNSTAIIDEAIEQKNIRDLRLLRPWIDLLDDSDWGDQIVEDVLPVLGKAAIAPLHQAFSLPGKSGDCYRLQGLVKLEGKAVEPLVMTALEKGSAELKETAIEELGTLNPNELLLRAPSLLKEKAAGVRRATIAGIAKHPSDAALEMLIQALIDDERIVSNAAKGALPKFEHPKRNERILALLTPELLAIKVPTPAEVRKELAAKEAEKVAKAAAKKAGAKKGAKAAKAPAKKVVAKKAVKKVAAKKVAKKVAKKRAKAIQLTPVEQKEYNKRRKEYDLKYSYVEGLIELLGECQIKEATPLLMKIFQEKNHTFNETATQALLTLGDPKAMAELGKKLESIKTSNDITVPLDAVFKMPPAQTYDALKKYFEPKVVETKNGGMVALAILERFTEDPWPSMLQEEDYKNQYLAEPRWASLVSKMIDHPKLGNMAYGAFFYVSRSWAKLDAQSYYEAVKPLLTKERVEDEKYADITDEIVDQIAYAYGDEKKFFDLPEWLEFLSLVVSTKNKKLKGTINQATEELVERNDPRAIPGLLSMLAASYQPWNFFEWLQKFHDPRIAPALLKRLQGKHKLDLGDVYETVRQQQDKAVLPTLQKMLLKKKRGKEAEEIKKTIKHLES
jgi:hypothetical protein